MRLVGTFALVAVAGCCQVLEQQPRMLSGFPMLVEPDGAVLAVDRVLCGGFPPRACERYLVYRYAPDGTLLRDFDLLPVTSARPAVMRRDPSGRVWLAGVNADGSGWLTDLDHLRPWLPPGGPAGTPVDLAFDAAGNPVLLLQRLYDGGFALLAVSRSEPRELARLEVASGAGNAMALAAAPNGDFYVAGHTRSPSFPVTPGAYQTLPPAGCTVEACTTGFVARVAGSLAGVRAATYLGGSAWAWPGAVAAAPDGSIYVAGGVFKTLDPAIFPTTAGAWQRQASAVPPPKVMGAGGMPTILPATTGFVARLDASLARLIDSTLVGGESSDGVSWLAIDSRGRVLLGGVTDSLQLPGTGAFRTNCGPDRGPRLNYGVYLGVMDPGLRSVESFTSIRGVVAGSAPAFALDGTAWWRFDQAVRWVPDLNPTAAVSCVVGMDYLPAFEVAGGQLLTIFGQGFARETRNFAGLPELPLAVDGTAVEIAAASGGTVPVPILAITPTQINVVLPRGDGLADAALTVRSGGEAIDSRRLVKTGWRPTALLRISPDGKLTPGTIRGSTWLAALADVLNEDGEPNSAAHPARPGELVTLFVTGLGPTDPEVSERAPGPEVPARPVQPVRIELQDRSLVPEDVSTIPGRTTGVMQIRFRIPGDFAAPEMGFTLMRPAEGAAFPYFLYVAR